MDTSIIPLAHRVAARTPKGDYIISFQSLWYPYFILFAERKGLIISPVEYDKYSCDLIKKYNYSTLVVVDTDLDVPERLGIFNCFQNVRMVEPNIYKVTP
jgi:hypothetical protein